MRTRMALAAVLLFLCVGAWGQVSQSNGLGILRNARYVYVTSYDGPEFSQNLLQDDRAAIAAVQNALEQDGHYVVVYQPWEAEMIVMVQSRPSEDLLAVYDASTWPNGSYLWRASAKGGLSTPGVPLVKQLQASIERVGSSSSSR